MYLNIFRYQKYGVRLKDLKSEKRQVLEEVIETESFKNAKELLERFDPESTLLQPTALQANSMMMTPSRPERPLANPNTPIPVTPYPNMELRRRKPHQVGQNMSYFKFIVKTFKENDGLIRLREIVNRYLQN